MTLVTVIGSIYDIAETFAEIELTTNNREGEADWLLCRDGKTWAKWTGPEDAPVLVTWGDPVGFLDALPWALDRVYDDSLRRMSAYKRNHDVPRVLHRNR